MERDRETIGLTPQTQALLASIEQRGWFLEGQDIARFCLAYAIRAKVGDGVTSETETRWAAGNFDKTGEIRALIAALYPECKTPVRLMEHLVNEGLRLVANRLESSAIGPAELLD
jgi:hypothetical protein